MLAGIITDFTLVWSSSRYQNKRWALARGSTQRKDTKKRSTAWFWSVNSTCNNQLVPIEIPTHVTYTHSHLGLGSHLRTVLHKYMLKL